MIVARVTRIALIAGLCCGATARAADIDPRLKLGVSLPLSGPLEPYARDTLAGIETALEEWREQNPAAAGHVTLLIEDDHGLISAGEDAAKRLIDVKKVDVIIGSLMSDVTIAIGAVAGAARRPVVTPSAVDIDVTKRGGAYVFRTCLAETQQGTILGILAARHLKKKAAVTIATEGSEGAKALTQRFNKTFSSLGGIIAGEFTVAAGRTELRETVDQVMRKQPDVVLLALAHPDVARVGVALREAGLKPPLIGPDGWDTPTLKLGEGHFFAAHFAADETTPHVAAFRARYERLRRKQPSVFAAQGYEAAKVVFDAFRRAQSARSEALVRALARTDLALNAGTLTFDPSRDAIRSMAIMSTTATGTRFFTRIAPTLP